MNKEQTQKEVEELYRFFYDMEVETQMYGKLNKGFLTRTTAEKLVKWHLTKQKELLEELNIKISKQLSTDDKRYFNEYDVQTYYTIDCNNKEITKLKHQLKAIDEI